MDGVYVILSVADLNDDETLGKLVVQILPILDQFSADVVPGPKEGFIEFSTVQILNANTANGRMTRISFIFIREIR